MKSTLWFALLTTTLFISSCKKDEDKPTVDLATVKVRTVQHSNSGLSETYAYDADGRITQLQLSNGTKTTHSYVGDTLTITSLDNTGALLSTEVILLSSGLAQSSVVTDSTATVVAFHQYGFNSAGEQTLHAVFNTAMEQTFKEEWIWQYGSITEYKIFDSTASPIYNLYYWYNYPGASSTGKVNTGKKYLGADPIYQVRKILQTGSAGNTYRTIEYTSDDQKRVTAALYYDQNHNLVNTDSYSYY